MNIKGKSQDSKYMSSRSFRHMELQVKAVLSYMQKLKRKKEKKDGESIGQIILLYCVLYAHKNRQQQSHQYVQL